MTKRVSKDQLDKIEKAEYGRQQKRMYSERKQFILPLEKENYDRIIFFRSTNDFFVAIGHSAIILYNMIAPELGLRLDLRRDGDWGTERSYEGMVAIKNLEYFKKNLIESRYIKEKYDETNDRLVFHLKKKLSKEEYRLLVETENIKRERLLNLASSSYAMPEVYKALRGLVETTYNKVDLHSNANARKLATYPLLDMAKTALRAFLVGARKEATLNVALKDAEANLNRLLVELIVVEATGVWKTEQCERIGMMAANAIEQIAVVKKQRNIR